MTSSYTLSGTGDIGEIDRLLDVARKHDGIEPLSEHKSIRRGGSEDSIEIIGRDSGATIGYGQAAWHRASPASDEGHWGVEIVLLPGRRTTSDVKAAVDGLAPSVENKSMRVWATAPYVASGLEAAGYIEVRRLLRMGCQLPRWRGSPLGAGIRLASFRPGLDDSAWLALNNSSFAGHPENGSLSPADLAERMRQSWFDEEGFLLAWDANVLVGFCWTKVHPDGTGEIYIIAVAREAAGRGLGKGLLTAGLVHLAVKGAPRAIVYTDAGNAEGFYSRAGFTVEESTAQFERPSGLSKDDHPKR